MDSLPVLTFIVFLVLKLTDYIDWSWWWVTAPLWIPVCVALVWGLLVILFTGNQTYFRRF